MPHDVDRFDTQKHLGTVVDRDHPDPVVEFGAWYGAAGRWERRPWPGHLDVGAEAGHAKPVVAHPAVEPRSETQEFELGDGARGQSVAAGLVARELRGVDDEYVSPGSRRPRRGG